MKRVVTGVGVDGRDVILSESEIHAVKGLPGSTNETRVCWTSPALVSLPASREDALATQEMSMPGPGETRFLFVTFAPHSSTPLHMTETRDYVVVVSGEIWLIMEDGGECCISVGDSVIQNGTNHIWENRSSEPCTIAATLIGAIMNDPSAEDDS